ncbi:hypothetical protein G6646_00080 [Polynucleobacter paneuropaeus]|nr:hypothetical protein [Polynucleobacter paneuropaeus]
MISTNDCVDLIRLRLWQHHINERLKKKHFSKIPIHLSFGHEALALAISDAMKHDDALCLTHRNAIYNLARSMSLEAVLNHYEIENESSGMGSMASMNLALADHGVAYASSILGNNLPFSAGIAMQRNLQGKNDVIFVLTGDGAMEEGVFWETLVFAKSHKLNLIIVVENNNCSMSSTIEQRRAPIYLDALCKSLGISYFSATGVNLSNIRSSVDQAYASAVSGCPALIEVELLTFCNHAGPTPGWDADPRSISIENGLLLSNEESDPLWIAANAIGIQEFNALITQEISQQSLS